MSDLSAERAQALTETVHLYRERFAALATTNVDAARAELLATASAMYRWLAGPVRLSLTYGPIVEQGTLNPTGKDGAVVTQLRDTQQFTLTLTAQDAKGAEVLDDATTAADDPTWSTSDEVVFTLAVDPANPRSATVVAGLPGSAVGTVALGEVSATFAVDVVPGAIAMVSLAEGPISEQ